MVGENLRPSRLPMRSISYFQYFSSVGNLGRICTISSLPSLPEKYLNGFGNLIHSVQRRGCHKLFFGEVLQEHSAVTAGRREANNTFCFIRLRPPWTLDHHFTIRILVDDRKDFFGEKLKTNIIVAAPVESVGEVHRVNVPLGCGIFFVNNLEKFLART